MKTSDGKKSKLQQEIIELKKKLESDTLAHRESELALRKVLPGVIPSANFSLATFLNPVNLISNVKKRQESAVQMLPARLVGQQCVQGYVWPNIF